MRHFVKIAECVDVIPLLNALSAREDLWNEHTIRTAHPDTAHADIDDILVWFNDLDGEIVNDIQTMPSRAWFELPQIRPLVFDLMRRVEATQLGRVIITRLPPGKCITPHVDGGAPATFYSRYQLALQSMPGALFESGGEVINFRMGEWWKVDNRVLHSVTNNSADDRIAMVVDVRLA